MVNVAVMIGSLSPDTSLRQRLAMVPGLPSDQTRSAKAGGGAKALSGRRILIVEDEAMLALDLEFAFEDAGAHVLGPAVSLEQALALIGGLPEIDVAVLDVDLAGKPVIPVAEALAAIGVPFVFHTGHGDRIDLLAGFPGARLLMKPVLTARLVAEVASLLG
jgi:DNA-binding response OmpR family regulator